MTFPFKFSIISPLHKKVNINMVSNFRGLTFLKAISKIYAGILLKRLLEWMMDEMDIIREF